MEIVIRDEKGNIIFETDKNIKAYLEVKVDRTEDIISYKSLFGENKIVNATDVRVWSL